MRSQRGEGGDGHVVRAISSLSATSALRRGDDLGLGLTIWVPGTLLWMAVVHFVPSTAPILNVVAITLLMFHDTVDDARGVVLAVVLRTTSQLVFLALVVALVDVAAGIAGMPILIKVGAEVAILGTVRPRLLGVVLIDLLLDGGEVAVHRSIGSTARMAT
jgi:hypothetical protein